MVEKFHWSFEYVVWGISYLNLQMLLADSQEYFPDYSNNEQKKEDEIVKADDPANRDLMHAILGWN